MTSSIATRTIVRVMFVKERRWGELLMAGRRSEARPCPERLSACMCWLVPCLASAFGWQVRACNVMAAAGERHVPHRSFFSRKQNTCISHSRHGFFLALQGTSCLFHPLLPCSSDTDRLGSRLYLGSVIRKAAVVPLVQDQQGKRS